MKNILNTLLDTQDATNTLYNYFLNNKEIFESENEETDFVEFITGLDANPQNLNVFFEETYNLGELFEIIVEVADFVNNEIGKDDAIKFNTEFGEFVRLVPTFGKALEWKLRTNIFNMMAKMNKILEAQ